MARRKPIPQKIRRQVYEKYGIVVESNKAVKFYFEKRGEDE